MKIHCEDIHFGYSERRLLRDLRLTVNSGEHIWIRGQSGSGKSSLLKLIAGLLPLQSGEILLDSFSLAKKSEIEKKDFRLGNVGYVHQENHLIDHWTVWQNLQLVGASDAEIKKTLEKFGLELKISNQLLSSLSGGEKQRVSLARVFLQRPAILLLDEPTAHLDDINTALVLNLIQSEFAKSTVVIVSHDSRIERLNLKMINLSEINQ